MTEVTVFDWQKELSLKPRRGPRFVSGYAFSHITTRHQINAASASAFDVSSPVPEFCYTVPLKLRQNNYAEALVTK
jgi:hypothetical protein